MSAAIKLIVSDMDGTLLNSQKEISATSVKTIQLASQAGVIFCFGTGRNFHDLQKFYHVLATPFAGILLNGGLVMNAKHEIISKTFFTADDIQQLVQILSKYPVYIEVQNEYENYTNSIAARVEWLCNTLGLTYTEFASSIYNKEIKQVQYTPTFFATNKIAKIVMGNIHNLDLSEIISDIKQQVACEISSSGSSNLEINPTGVCKGQGIKILCEHYNFDLQQVLAIGDNLNDLSMLETAGYFYAMQNSNPKILAKAKYVTSDNNHDGVAKAIMQVLNL